MEARKRSAKRVIWTNPIVGKVRPGTWPAEAIEGKPLPELTKQEYKQECDINEIVKTVVKTGNGALLQKTQGYYADVSNLPKSYDEALRQIQDADAAFNALPAEVREEFKHEPGALIEFVKNPKNKARAIELGLIAKPVEAPPKPVDTSGNRDPGVAGEGGAKK